MIRLASLMSFLALGSSLAGAIGFYWLYRPVGLEEWIAAALDFGKVAVAHPLVPIAAGTAVLSTLLVRFLERPLRQEPRRKVHELEVKVPAPRPDDEVSTGTPPGKSAALGERERLKLRLDALLRGHPDIVSFVDELLGGAVESRASDIHIEPRQGYTRLVFRVEGELVAITSVAESWHAAIVRRLKVLAELVPYKTAEPQDGRFSLDASGSALDVRLSSLPTQHGEKVVLRFVRPGAGLRAIDELGMDAATLATFRRVLTEPQGLVILAGPTGSGKTTTLYSALDHLHQERGETAQIASIEDPVEVDLPFLSQTQVDRSKGLDFSSGLRSLLRQDPNVLMVGEVRDAETAGIAVQAGLSGHLILTSLHADSTAGVFARLIDMGIEPFLIASSTLACLSQRLVRLLCPDCRRPFRPDAKTATRLIERGIALEPDPTFYRSEGCRACGDSGVRKRTALFEMLHMTPELRRKIAAKTPTQEIEDAAREAGMKSLFKSAVEMALAGRIDLEEALRIAR